MQNSLQFWLFGTEWFLNLVGTVLVWVELVDLYRMVDGMWLIGTELLMDLGLVGTERLKDLVSWWSG